MKPWNLDRLGRLGGRRRSAAATTAWPVLDLLRETRQDIGQQTIAPVLAERRGLLLQGSGAGAVLLGLVLGISGLVFLRHQMVKAEMGRLNAVETEAAALQQQLARNNKQMAAITDVNRQLSSALSNVRPTSALMADLQLRTPDGVQLLSAEAGSANLNIKGLASDPLAFERINALQLELRRSPLLDPLGVSLSRLERRPEASPKQSKEASPVQFELSARFAPLEAARLQQVLLQLGSQGMARRLAVMQKEGLLP